MTDLDESTPTSAGSALIRDRYEPAAVLGRGGQGEVVRALDHQHEREVALKIRPVRDVAERRALLAEARILLSLRPHPNLPLVREDFFWEDRYVLAMDFIDGTDLRHVLGATGDPGLPVRPVVSWLEQAADALGHLHAQGVVHGDVKPANLVLTAEGAVVLVDFGIARRTSETGGHHFGTPGYAAPELHTGGMTPAVDVYGLAATAVALLTGSPPSVGRPDWQGVEHAVAIERALRRGLAIDPARRPRSAADLIARLRTHLALDLPAGIVTFLLTDIEGSTARWEADPDGMAEAVARHDAVLADAVEANDGRLLKSRGEGDATFSVFARASDAVGAALDAQRSLLPVDLPVRMAIHTGEAEVRDGDYFGRTVNRASRLRTVARAGQIVLSGAAADLAGHALPAGSSLTDLGFRELRDLARGEQVFALVHPDVGAAEERPELLPVGAGRPRPVPPPTTRLPNPLTILDEVTFVGRQGDLDRLTAAWRSARTPERRVVLIGGESGIGKTHLTAALARAVQADGGAVLYGACDEGLQVPYQPFAAALAEAAADAIAENAVPLLGRHPGELARLAPQLMEQLPHLEGSLPNDPESEQHLLFEAVADWLRSVSGIVPLLFIVDDLHWATRPTLQLFRHVVRTLDPQPLLIVGTFREEDTGRRPALAELLADLHRVSGIDRTTLSGLSAPEVFELLEHATGRRLAPSARALARSVRAETGGNPFFVRQFLRHLIDNGTLVANPEGHWTVERVAEPLGVPEGIRDVMVRRLARLSEATVRTLEVAAVAGAEFELRVVARAAGTDDDTVLTAVEEAVGARLVTETGPFVFRFSHSLVRSSILDGLSRARLRRLHRQIAESIESVFADGLSGHRTELARHYAGADTPADAERAVSFARQAGDEALARLAYDEAASHFRLAIDLLDRSDTDSDSRSRLLLALGESQRLAGDATYRETLLDAARAALNRGDGELAARAVLANRRALMGWMSLPDPERVAVLEAAIDAQAGTDDATLARLLALLGFELVAAGHWSRRVALSDRAVAIVRRAGDPAALAEVLDLRSETLAHPSTLEERLALADEQIELTEGMRDPAPLVRALLNGVVAGFEAGRLDLVDSQLDRAERLADEHGQPALRWRVKVQRAKRLALAGRLDEAGRATSDAFQVGQAAGQADAPLVFATQHFWLSWLRGRLDEVRSIAMGAVGEFPERPGLLVATARILEGAGRRDEARAELAKLVALGLDWLPRDANALTIASIALVSASRLRLPELAVLVAPVLAPYRDHIVADRTNVIGSVVHFLGLAAFTLGDLELAEEELNAAIDVHRRLSAPALLATSQAELARVLAERGWPGDHTRAGRLVDEARTTGTELGMSGIVADLSGITT